MFCRNFMFMLVHACESWSKNLHAIHTNIAGMCVGILGMNYGKCYERPAILIIVGINVASACSVDSERFEVSAAYLAHLNLHRLSSRGVGQRREHLAVVRQLRGKRLIGSAIYVPLAICAYVGYTYLHSIPTSGNDLALILIGSGAGLTLGTLLLALLASALANGCWQCKTATAAGARSIAITMPNFSAACRSPTTMR